MGHQQLEAGLWPAARARALRRAGRHLAEGVRPGRSRAGRRRGLPGCRRLRRRGDGRGHAGRTARARGGRPAGEAVTPVVAMTVAGSDSGGGAGVQADLRTFTAYGVFGTCAITALPAQNTTAVLGVLPVPADFVVQQVEAVLADLDVRAVKTGMLATAEIVTAVAVLAAAGRLPNLVVDP